MGFRGLVTAVAVGIASGCGGGGVSGPSEPSILEITAGLNQTGQVGAALAIKLIVKASNERGGVAGVTITMSPGAQSGSVSPHS